LRCGLLFEHDRSQTGTSRDFRASFRENAQ
jgi:hypothetical protein